jgi:hypothetical protein
MHCLRTERVGVVCLLKCKHSIGACTIAGRLNKRCIEIAVVYVQLVVEQVEY